MKIKLSELIIPSFQASWKNQKFFRHNIEKGGRNSGKSVLHALRMVFNRMNTLTSGLCVRRYGNALRDSMFVDIGFAIKLFRVEHLWKFSYSPLRYTYLPTGTSILFRGADDALRLKGLKTEFPISDCWFDELADFKQEEDLDIIINTVLRAQIEDKYTFLYSYNPPKRKGAWCNKKYNTNNVIPDTAVQHSTFYDNPFASAEMHAEAESMKQSNFLKYEWLYLGKPIGGGLVPFNNLVFRKITDEELSGFDNIVAGIDWGYASDPFFYVRAHYDKTRKKLYFIGEIYGLKISNLRIIDTLQQQNWFERIIADSASPKDIADFRDAGFHIIGAKKGPGSVEYGERWLNDELAEIVIDYNRTPGLAKQFEDIDYQVDKNGNVLPRLEGSENDAIDATRYMLEREMGGHARIY
jgi:phage terminase large subunit